MRKDETADCIALNSYLKLLEPHCSFAYTFSANGGVRDKKTGSVLKKCGVTPGVWDYYFRAHGKPTLWIEMKHGTNGLTTEQKEWREKLEPEGDLFRICYTAEDALRALVKLEYIPEDMVFFGPRVVSIRLIPRSIK